METRFYAETWGEFLSCVREARTQLGNPAIIWYRGQSRESYKLVPSLIRRPLGLTKEKALFDDYERFASHLQAGRNSDWDMLHDMQHYGIPTRLMDWTDVLGIAVAFALYDEVSDDAAIYVLDPVGLNKLSGVSEVKRTSNDSSFDYKSVYWDGRPFSPSFPIAIDSRLHNDRMRAQSGSFTVHGNNEAPLDEQNSKVIRKIIIGSSAKQEAHEFLEHANLNPFSIYPDVVGMAQYLVRKHLR